MQDQLEVALSSFAAVPQANVDSPLRLDPQGAAGHARPWGRSISTVCAGRTDAGVHALNQVVHIDAPVARAPFSWVRGTNRFLPADIAVQWCVPVAVDFHARNSARGRRYVYLLLESAVRPALEAGAVGWVFRPLDADAMRAAAACLIGEHDFSSFRSSQCQSPTPVKTLRSIAIERRGAVMGGYWRFDFDGNAFLHHMVRNIMGCLVAVGQGLHTPSWMAEVLAAKSRDAAAPTFASDGLYFAGPYYDAVHGVPQHTPAFDWLPG